MDWKSYAVQVFDAENKAITQICIVEAPSPGSAVEIYLAAHGVLSYKRVEIHLAPDNIQPHLSHHDIPQWYPDIEQEATELDEHHTCEILAEQVTIDLAEYEGLQQEIADAHEQLTKLGVSGLHHSLAGRVQTMATMACANELEWSE